MICWYCHWGWAKPVAEIYRKYEKLVGKRAMRFGPGHIVWEDENFTKEDIEWCLNEAPNHGDLTKEEWDLVHASLRELLEVPESVRCCTPSGYDGKSPENYPPSVEVMHP